MNTSFVSCPYNQHHKMPARRLIYHLVKCKSRQERLSLGLPDFHCKYNYNHISFTQEELLNHEKTCESQP